MRRLLPVVVLTAALIGPGYAQDPVLTLPADEPAEEEEAGSPLSVTIDHSIGYNSELAGLYTEHEADFFLEVTRWDVTFTVDLWLGLATDWATSTATVDFPGVEFTAAAPKFGEVQFWDAGSALTEACVVPADGSANVGNEDLMTVGTCAGFADGQTVMYITPPLGPFKVFVSGMADARGVIETGEVDSAVSAAVAFEQTINDVTWSASLGVDHALSIKDGLPPGNNLPTTVQGGIAAEWATWRVGAAGQVDVVSFDGTPVWAAGVGVTKTVNEKLTLTAELATGAYTDTGDPIQEVSFGATAEYTLIPDTLTVDAGANVLRRTSPGGVNDTVFQVETGIELSF